jgi:hypothetical protein
VRTKPASARERTADASKARKPAARVDDKARAAISKSAVKVVKPVKASRIATAAKGKPGGRVPAPRRPARKPVAPADVMVLGEHPAAYFAAALIRSDHKIRVLHCRIPGEAEPDRLVVINPAFFSLHPLLAPLQRKLETTALYGLQFLSDDPAIKSEHRSKAALAYVASYHAVRDLLAGRARDEGVDLVSPDELHIHRLDEVGLEVTVDGSNLRPRVLALGGNLSDAQHKLLGLPESWGADIIHRYSYLKLPGNAWADLGSRPIMPMSLSLNQTLCWGWLLPGTKGMQLAVAQPMETLSRIRPVDLLTHWASVLRANGILSDHLLPLDHLQSKDLPLAGALAHEGVANRTLLIGPAGGFYSACTEDIYPNCWSALFAADAIKKALKERHLQDALQPYRSKWRTTLGEYLRGPQQNFRFLLPFIYRNQVMTTRLTESILQGKSVVR